ncbi:MAG: TM2 domain-containing protein [Defluviitaleaceae bacterium]|nr:TM2 domain-containing protein [Defluviitaleaceae bacterium]
MKEFFNPTLPEGEEGVVGDRSRVLAGVLGFFFGTWGIHMFVLGYFKKGMVYLITTLICWGVNMVFLTLFIVSTVLTVGGGNDNLVLPIIAWAGMALFVIPVNALGICSIVSSAFILTNKRYIDADGKLLK